MNKRFLLVAALCAAMNLSAFAQTNLAEGKTAVASTETTAEPASKAVDGDFGTRWQINSTDASETSENQMVTGGHWIYIDLGEVQEFNTIRIKWEGAYAKGFEIYTATEKDGDQPKWGEKVYEKNESLSNFDKYYTYNIGTQKARYVKMQATELGYPGNYLSLFEMGVYNITEAAAITKISTSTDIVKVGNTFTVKAFDQLDQEMENADITVTNAEKQADGSYKALAAGDIVITATANGKTISKTIQAYAPELTTVAVSPAFVVTNKETELTFTAKDQQGEAISDFTTSLKDNKLTATEDGKQEITVSWNGTEKKVAVYAISKAVDAPELGDTDLSIYADDATGLGISDAGWNGQYGKQEQLDLNGNKVFMVTNAGTFGIKNEKITNDGYTSLNFDIFPTADVDGHVTFEGSGLADMKFHLTAGEWNHVSLDITGANALNSWIQIYTGAAGANNPDILLDNVYLSKKAAEVKEEVLVAKAADEQGFVAVTGYAKSADIINKALTDANVTAWDLSGLKTDGSYTITPANPNAMIQVAGTENNGVGVPTAEWGETKNLVVKRGDGYFFPVKQLEITDDTNPVYTTFFISTGSTGWKYTRQLPANTWATTVLPAAAEIPAGCKVYEITENTEAENSVLLKEATALNAKTPYIIYNSNAEEATLTTSGTGDFDLRNDIEATVGDVTVHGTFQKLNGNGTMYGLQGQTGETKELKLQKIGEDATTAPFRVYFTGANVQALSIKFPGGGTTGINDINAETGTQKANGVYTLDGRKVSDGASLNNLPQGIYIVNGKKVIK